MADVVANAVTGVFDMFDADGAFTNVYAKHDEADLDLPGLTIGPERVEQAMSESTGGVPGAAWYITVSIRVHSSYTDGMRDQSGLVDLVDDVIQKIKKNHGVISGYGLSIVEVEFNLSFGESESVGAQVNATYLTGDVYTQE